MVSNKFVDIEQLCEHLLDESQETAYIKELYRLIGKFDESFSNS